MTDLLDKYADCIIDSFLNLKKGDCLSINTEESDFGFARLVANKALLKTCTIVKIVQTSEGKPTEVIDFDPELSSSVEATGFAMLRICHVNEDKISDEKVLDVVVDKDDLRAVQKLGHLAEPVVLDRRVAVPWASVPVYSTQDKRWEDILSMLSRDVESCVLTADYRKKFFNHSDIDAFKIKGNDTDLEIGIPEGCVFRGGSTKLANGRKFVSTVDFGNFYINADMNSVCGKISAKAVILGKKTDLKLEFKDGKLVKYSPCKELDTMLEFDSNLGKIGYICFGDKKLSLFMGGALTDCIEQLPESEEELPKWFNPSLYTIELKLDDNLNVLSVDCSNKENEIIRRGLILE